MARMAYEQFRNSRNNLYYEVKSQWYQLCNISEQYKNTQANLRLLDQLEQLALNRFSAPSAKAGGSSVLPSPGIFCSIDSSRRIRWRYVGYGR